MAYMQLWTDANNLILPCEREREYYFAIFSDIAKSLNLRPCSVTLVAQMVKHLPVMWETWVRSLGQEDPPEKEMATHSSTLAWRIPWTEDLVGYSAQGRKESDTTEQLHLLLVRYNCRENKMLLLLLSITLLI